jgi:hypothetical protein
MSFQAVVRTATILTGAHGSSAPPRQAPEAAPVAKEYTLSEYLQQEHGRICKFKNLTKPGRSLAARYRQISGMEPGQKLVEVNGRATSVKSYTNDKIEGSNPEISGFGLMLEVAQEFQLI